MTTLSWGSLNLFAFMILQFCAMNLGVVIEFCLKSLFTNLDFFSHELVGAMLASGFDVKRILTRLQPISCGRLLRSNRRVVSWFSRCFSHGIDQVRVIGKLAKAIAFVPSFEVGNPTWAGPRCLCPKDQCSHGEVVFVFDPHGDIRRR